MKKLKLILIFTISLVASFAETINIKKGVNIRENPSIKSSVIGIIRGGDVYQVLESYSDYIYIEVIKGEDKKHTSDHLGKKGWMWSERIKDGYVIIKGCTLRSSPEKIADDTPNDTSDDHNFVAKVKKNAKIKVIKKNIIWFRIDEGWISSICVQ